MTGTTYSSPAKSVINRRHKKIFFPLADETSRAKSHTDDYRTESNLLLHPSLDNPEDHISFNRYVPVAKDKRGELSITAFGIDRPKLNGNREGYLQNVKTNEAFAKVDLDNLTEQDRQEYSRIMNQSWPVLETLILTAKAFVAKATADNQPFTTMVRANFPDLIHKP